MHTIAEQRFHFPPAGSSVLSIPAIIYPYPLTFSPHYTAIRDDHFAWYLSYQTHANEAEAQADIACDFAAMSAMAYPNCSRERLRVIADFSAAIAFRDDRFDDMDDANRAQLYDSAVSSYAAGYTGDTSAWERMFYDVQRRFLAGLSAGQRRRWDENFRIFLKGMSGMVGQPAERSVAEYITFRRRSIGQHIDVSFVEYTMDDLELPESLMAEPLVERLIECHVDCVWLMQDLLSCQIELGKGEQHNIVMRLAAEHGCSLQQAIDMAHAMLERTLAHWVELREQARQAGFAQSHELQRLITGLDQFAVGWGEWSRWSPRYGRAPIDWAAQYGTLQHCASSGRGTRAASGTREGPASPVRVVSAYV